jgi:hypothetical protein
MHKPSIMNVEPEFIFFENCAQNSKEVFYFLKNSTAHPMAWKVKMTAPSRYKMSPKRGVIKPLETEVIKVQMVYNKYPPNQPMNEKRERDSNGVFFDRFQFESIIIASDPTPNTLRVKSWWKETFSNSEEICTFKSKVFFTLADNFPQADLDILLAQVNASHSTLDASGSLQELSNSSLLNFSQPDYNHELKGVESSQQLQPLIIEMEENNNNNNNNNNKNNNNNNNNPQLSPRKETEKLPVQEGEVEKLPINNQSSDQPQRRQSSNLSPHNTPVQSPLKSSSSPQISNQQPILKPPEKSIYSLPPLISTHNSPKKESSTNTTNTTSTTSISSGHPVKELNRTSKHNTIAKTKEESSVASEMCGVLKTMIFNNLFFILAFLFGFYARHLFG